MEGFTYSFFYSYISPLFYHNMRKVKNSINVLKRQICKQALMNIYLTLLYRVDILMEERRSTALCGNVFGDLQCFRSSYALWVKNCKSYCIYMSVRLGNRLIFLLFLSGWVKSSSSLLSDQARLHFIVLREYLFYHYYELRGGFMIKWALDSNHTRVKRRHTIYRFDF